MKRALQVRSVLVVGGLALLATVLPGAAAQAAPAKRQVPQGWLGVTVDGPVEVGDAKEWDRMARAGVETVRTAFTWSRVQPRPPDAADGSLDFRSTDVLAVAAASHGIRLLPVVQSPPVWAAVEPWTPTSPPADFDAVRKFFAALAERYGPRGSLWTERPDLPRLPIRAWQVFNEPNLSRYWTVQPFEPHYAATIRAAATGIRSVDPRAKVVLGGLTNKSWEALAGIYAAGARGSFDAVAIHPYTATPANVVRVARYVRRVMRINGDGSLPIWVTEFSWPATSWSQRLPPWAEVFGDPITDARQARLLSRTIRRFVAARERLRIARLVWYTWLSHDVPGSYQPFDFSGLRRTRDGVSRNAAAFHVFRRWARLLEGCAKTSNAQRCR